MLCLDLKRYNLVGLIHTNNINMCGTMFAFWVSDEPTHLVIVLSIICLAS